MEMNGQFLFQVGAVIASLSGAWALVRSQVHTLKANQVEIKNYVDELNRELDTAENAVSVLRSQIKVLADILSPGNQKLQHEWQGEVTEKLNQMEKAIITLQHMHNGRHPVLEEIQAKNKS
tara:strand:- start:11 stop:373 length:363 start_codon:yes stop_codon:yes gene_type:complete